MQVLGPQAGESAFAQRIDSFMALGNPPALGLSHLNCSKPGKDRALD